MNAAGILRDWRGCVRHLPPSLHAHQTHALADLSPAVAKAGDCRAGRCACELPSAATPPSVRRRFERLLANPRLSPARVQLDWGRSLLAGWADGCVRLILDETARGPELRAMCVRVGYARRALPVAWRVYRRHAPPRRMPHLIRGLLRQVRRCLPAGCQALLPADRGLAWPLLVDFCREAGWHYLLRLQGTTRVRFPDGSERAVRELAPRPGAEWVGPAEVFKKAGWRGAEVVAVWERTADAPWLLVTDQPASVRHCRVYAGRMGVEESFRDDKSGAFEWERSQVNDPTHAARLLLLLALAMVLAASLGGQAIKGGRRRVVDPHRRRRLSWVQIGLHWLRYAWARGWYHLIRLKRLYLFPP